MKLIDNGADFLIKKFLAIICIFLIYGCQSIQIFEQINDYKNSIFETKKYSYSEILQIKPDKTKLIVSLNNGDEYLAFFSSKSNLWISSDNSKFFIRNAKVIESFNLQYDFEIINFKGINIEHNAYFRFKNPDSGYLPINYSYKQLEEGELYLRTINQNVKYKLYKEDFNIDLLSWSGSNYYWLDFEGNLIRLDQEVNSFGDRITLTK
tara:strand:- start:200 stop:823 length:624 start_codon:yes stop_codon:yes gene_type:complete